MFLAATRQRPRPALRSTLVLVGMVDILGVGLSIQMRYLVQGLVCSGSGHFSRGGWWCGGGSVNTKVPFAEFIGGGQLQLGGSETRIVSNPAACTFAEHKILYPQPPSPSSNLRFAALSAQVDEELHLRKDWRAQSPCLCREHQEKDFRQTKREVGAARDSSGRSTSCIQGSCTNCCKA